MMKNKELIIVIIFLICIIIIIKNISSLEIGSGVGLKLKINQTASNNNNTNNQSIEEEEEYIDEEEYVEDVTGSRTDNSGTFSLGNAARSVENNNSNNINNKDEEKLIKNQTVQQAKVSITVNKPAASSRFGITGLFIFDNSNMQNEIKYGGIIFTIFLVIILVTLVIIERKH